MFRESLGVGPLYVDAPVEDSQQLQATVQADQLVAYFNPKSTRAGGSDEALYRAAKALGDVEVKKYKTSPHITENIASLKETTTANIFCGSAPVMARLVVC